MGWKDNRTGPGQHAEFGLGPCMIAVSKKGDPTFMGVRLFNRDVHHQPMSSSASASATASAASATSSATTATTSSNLKIVGIILAVVSGFLIGSSFVFKKKGLLRSQAGGTAGEGVAYLKSVLWWTGMIMMILGELCNSAAYAFVEAIVVTPLGALSVVICAILSSIFLKETLSLFGWLGCALCILGSVVIALNGPSEDLVGQIRDFQKLFLAPGFLAYIGVLITASLVIIFYFAPRYGKKSMLWYIFVCSMIGGISVSVTTGLGAAIVTTAKGDNQFKYWFIYFLIVFVAVTLITEVFYLNKALALYNTVTPTYYVICRALSSLSLMVLFQGLDSTVSEIITIVMGFLVICVGITILQLSKIDPTTLNKLDRRSTLLLQAARTKPEDMEEKSVAGMEDPGMDALRGSFGAVGSIIRARRMSQSSRVSYRTGRPPGAAAPFPPNQPYWPEGGDSTPKTALDHLSGVQRHQLYDAPVPHSNT
ncbi:magnesium transporter NIPA-domain-containing protein, partial [Mucidula mucida]